MNCIYAYIHSSTWGGNALTAETHWQSANLTKRLGALDQYTNTWNSPSTTVHPPSLHQTTMCGSGGQSAKSAWKPLR